MKNKNLIKQYIFLAVLTLIIIFLIVLFINLNYGKPSGLKGLPSLGLWKPVGGDFGVLNISENDSALEKIRQVETPSNVKTIESVFKRYWISFLILFSIAILLIAWVLIIFKIHNG